MASPMSGASGATERVEYVNANWTPSAGVGSGSRSRFELLIVTESGDRHALPVKSEDMAALIALTQASSVLLWDPEAEALIAANLVGQWLQDTWSARSSRREAGLRPAPGPYLLLQVEDRLRIACR